MSTRLDLNREFRRVRPARQPHLSRCPRGKVRYRDKREAISTLHRIQLKASYAKLGESGTTRRECRAYECDSCHGFHLTSSASSKLAELLAA